MKTQEASLKSSRDPQFFSENNLATTSTFHYSTPMKGKQLISHFCGIFSGKIYPFRRYTVKDLIHLCYKSDCDTVML